jgi:hypothetical protein
MAQAIIAVVGLAVGLATLFRAVLEFRAQGRQRRAEFFLKMMERFFSDQRFLQICALLDAEDEEGLAAISWPERREFLGFIEEVALLVNSKLISREIASYMFGYYPLRAAESGALMGGVNANSPYWRLFFTFVAEMKELESAQLREPAQLSVGALRF